MNDSQKILVAKKLLKCARKLKSIYECSEIENCGLDDQFHGALIGFQECLKVLEIPIELKDGNVYILGELVE